MKAFIHDDHDGRCAGSILYHTTKHIMNREDFIEMNYGKRIPTDIISRDEEIFFLDYSFSDTNIDQLKDIYDNITQNITWIDHHKTSVETLEKHKWLRKSKMNIFVETYACGAMLTYIYLNKDKKTMSSRILNDIPYYLRLIDDFDCWKLKMLPMSTHLKVAIDAYKDKSATSEIWSVLFNTQNRSDIEDLLDEGEIIFRYIESFNKEYLERNGYESTIDGITCYVCNIDSNSWVFGNLIKKYDVVLIWTFDGESYDYSIYSENKNVDCSTIAKKYGGGGHPGASGFRTNELILKKNI